MSDTRDLEIGDTRELDGFDLDTYYQENRAEPFRFRWGGRWWELPAMTDLPLDLLAKIDSLDLESGTVDIEPELIPNLLAKTFGAEQWEALNATRPLPMSMVPQLFAQWGAHGGDRGEESSSVVSSESTAGPSKPTSRATTKSGSAKRSTAAKKTATRRVNSSR